MAKEPHRRGTPMTQIPPAGHRSHDTSYGYFSTDDLVPQRLSCERAGYLIGRRERIYLTPYELPLRPQDRHDKYRRKFSFDWKDWHRNILLPAELIVWKQEKLEFETWDRIQKYAVRNLVKDPSATGGLPSNYLDYYRFIETEIIGVPVAAPDPENPFDLRWSDRSHQYFYIHYQGVDNGQKQKRRRKV